MSFVNGIFLFATAAAIVPVLLHLVRRIRPRPLPFGSLMFLRSTPRELIRKRRLQDRLLMAARAALLLLLAFVFARPYLPVERLPLVAQRDATSVVFVLDRSLSMQYEGVFDRAVRTVTDRLNALRPDDEAALIVFDDRTTVLAPLGTDHATIRSALSSARPSYRATDFVPALQQAADLLADARHARRRVILVSDLQESAWEHAPSDWKLPPSMAFEAISVADGNASNTYVEDVRRRARHGEGQQFVRYDARIATHGAPASDERVVSLSVEGRQVDLQRLPPRAAAPVAFEHQLTRDGFHQGELSLTPDRLPADDRYAFTYRSDPLPLLAVVDAPSSFGRRDAFYLRTAFEVGEASRFRIAPSDRVTSAILRDARVLFLSGAFPPAEELRTFLERGGTLVAAPGGSVRTESLSRLLEAFGVGSVADAVDAGAAPRADAIIGHVETRHPIFEPFAGSTLLLRPRFRRFVRFEPNEGTAVLARYDTGDAFLAERAVGKGRILVYTSTWNTSWTDLPLDEAFVPLLYQIAVYGTRSSGREYAFTVGDVVTLDGSPGATWEVRTPGDRHYRVSIDNDGRGLFRETEWPGHYTAAGEGRTEMFSVNVDPVESDLRTRDPDEVYASVAAGASEIPASAERAAVADDEHRQKLWRILLLGVILLFVAETYLAHRTRGTRATGVSSREHVPGAAGVTPPAAKA